jgi:hypothetical protein
MTLQVEAETEDLIFLRKITQENWQYKKIFVPLYFLGITQYKEILWINL